MNAPTWWIRELPILRAVVHAEEAGNDVQAAARAAVPELSPQRFMQCLARLHMDGYLDVAEMRNGAGKYVSVMIRRALPRTLREVGTWPQKATPLDEKRRRRLAFMDRLYDRTDGNPAVGEQALDIGAELGWAEDEILATVRYLADEGLLRSLAKNGPVAITHQGVVEIEEALDNPDTSTVHFPPISIVQVNGDVIGSQIQAGALKSSQEQGDP